MRSDLSNGRGSNHRGLSGIRGIDQRLFILAALATSLAAVVTLASPRTGIMLDVVAVVLVAVDLRSRIIANGQAEKLSEAIDSSREATVWEDVPGNPGAMDIKTRDGSFLGYSHERWLEPGFPASIVHPSDLDRVDRVAGRGRSRQNDFRVVFRAKGASGKWHWIEMRATSVRSRRGEHRMFAGVLLNRTADVEIAQEADILRRVVSESPLAHVIAERGEQGCFDVSSINGAAAALFGTPAAAAVGRPLGDLLANLSGLDELAAAVAEQAEATLRSVEVSAEVDGTRIVFETLIQGVGDKGIALTFNDISERVRATAMLREQALHDSLTGLPNRRFLAKRLASDLVDGASAGHAVSLITLDLDQFKEVNDALGHEVGDMLLIAMADRLVENAPSGSLVARLGGDEFAVLLPRATLVEARHHAESLAAISRESIVLDGLNLQIRASMGVVSSPVHGTDVAELMRLVDVAMYASKRSGRDVTTYDVADNPFSKRRVRLLGELEMGIEAGEFEVFYQPIVDMETEMTVATEGLLRWRHPELGLIPPGEFVELAEVTGTIGMLTRMVIRQVLTDAKILERAGFPVLMSANLSTRNLFEVDFVSAVTEIIAELGLPAAGLRLEITEGDIMEDVGRARQVMRALSATGITLAIDDFGTGHSSLERLRDLPVTCVKIDQGFVSSLLDGPRSQNLLRDILVMLDNLGFETVAEGVEDRSSYHLLGEFGCTHGQGFLWSRPVPLPDLLGYLTAEHDEVRTLGEAPLRARS